MIDGQTEKNETKYKVDVLYMTWESSVFTEKLSFLSSTAAEKIIALRTDRQTMWMLELQYQESIEGEESLYTIRKPIFKI